MTRTPTSREALLAVIRLVRSRWRAKVVLQGVGILLGSGLLLSVLSAWGMDWFRFGAGAVLTFRLLTWTALAGVAWRFLIRTLRRRVPDETVALYLEEHEPTLQGIVVTAVESGAAPAYQLSPALVQRVIEAAMGHCANIEYGRRVERTNLYRSSGIVVGVSVAALTVGLLSPPFLRHAVPLLLFPWARAGAANIYGINVAPGNARLARGADQKVTAKLSGFEAEAVDISVKTGANGKWERVPMSRDEESGGYTYLMLDVGDRTEYFVEASGVRSPVFHIDVADIPYVKQIDLEYRYPVYTGLAPEKVEDGGDIAAIRGTDVLVRATPTLRAAAGRIKIEGRPPVPMTVGEDGKLSGTIRVEQPGFYQIELQAPDGSLAAASSNYGIDVLPDRPPTVSFSKPGRDTRVTPIEEVFTEAHAQDDFGIKSLELVYSVNGAPETTVPLYQGERRTLRDVSAGHTIFLEELGLEAGDFISYFARATDFRPGQPQAASSDIYFIQVTPFGREYRAAESRGGMGGGNGGADGALSQRQREIIAATFKLLRDREQYVEREYQENLTTIKLAQTGLRQQVEALVQRMANRGVAQIDSGFKKIGDALPQATKEMEAAEGELDRRRPKEALPPEQRALKFLQRAEAVFRDVQVSMGSQGGGGGAGMANAEDLADLFELELDKLQNQYETVQRGQRQEMDNQLDETVQRLRELARRQEQENERARRLGSNLQQATGGGAGQRQLAQETEEVARKLERLAREQSLPDLANTARRLQQAAEAMRRGSTTSKDGRVASGLSALDRLEEARRLLEKNRTDRLATGAADALRQAEELAQEQQKIESDVQGLKPMGQNSPDQMIRLLQRKDQLAQGVQGLENQLDRMSRDAGHDRREAGRKLEEAANGIRDEKVKEKIRYSKGVVAGRSPEYAREFEGEITKRIEQLRKRVADASAATAGESKEDRLGNAVSRARDLTRGMEALDERIHQRQESGPANGQQGQEQQGRGGQASGRFNRGPLSPGRSDGGNGGAYAPGGWTADDIRQYQREFRERRRDAEALRQELQKGGLSAAELRGLIDRLKTLEDARLYNDPLAFERLRASVREGFKQFEYDLRRKVEGADREQLFLSGSEDVPAGYREMVEEYYRSLARTQK